MGSGGIVPPFFTSTLYIGEWLASRSYCFTPGERAPRTHWIGGWVGPSTGLDVGEKRKILPLPGIEARPSSPSLCRLRYPCSPFLQYTSRIIVPSYLPRLFCIGLTLKKEALNVLINQNTANVHPMCFFSELPRHESVSGTSERNSTYS
jgi:hypothetical protein